MTLKMRKKKRGGYMSLGRKTIPLVVPPASVRTFQLVCSFSRFWCHRSVQNAGIELMITSLDTNPVSCWAPVCETSLIQLELVSDIQLLHSTTHQSPTPHHNTLATTLHISNIKFPLDGNPPGWVRQKNLEKPRAGQIKSNVKKYQQQNINNKKTDHQKSCKKQIQKKEQNKGNNIQYIMQSRIESNKSSFVERTVKGNKVLIPQ